MVELISMVVKRDYSSQLRAAQARDTRRVIVAAAARLFVQDGYGITTIDAVAEAAGVSRKTVFTAVGGKCQLLTTALEWALVGDDEPVPLAQRPEVREIGRRTDPSDIIAGYVGVIVEIDSRVAELSQALVVAAGIDPEAREARDARTGQRLAGARAFVTHLANHDGLRADLDSAAAADIVWFHTDPVLYHRLVIERRWSKQRFTTWLQRTLILQLGPQPPV
jgi:AcrR family transcriptional regulator